MRTIRTRCARVAPKVVRSAATFTLAVSLVAAGCSSSSTSASTKPTTLSMSCGAERGLSTLVHGAEAAVVGTVREVTISPLGPESTHSFVREYRTAVVDVEEALWSSETLPVKAGESVTVQLLGNGRHEGDPYGCGLDPNARWNDMAGPMVEGSRVLLLLRVFDLFDGMDDLRGDGLGNFPAGWARGNWTIEGDEAVGVVPERNAPLRPLVDRLGEVHRAPLDRESRRGVIDPLEATEPGPASAGPLE